MRRFAPALLVSVAVVAMAPYAGEIRDWIEAALAERYVRWMGIGFAVAVAAVVVWAISRIREDRALRYALLVVGLALLVGQLAGWSRDNAAVNAVERIHFLYYGLLGVLYFRAFRSTPRRATEDGRPHADASTLLATVLAVLLVALADEGVQWWVAARTGEIYDVVLDVYAGATGLLLALAVDGPRDLRWRLASGAGRRLARLAAVAMVALAAFVHAAHLAYLIEDGEIGRFRSYFTLEALREASRDRAQRWAARPLGPPGEFAPLEREDWFRSEAGMRVHHRNASYQRGDSYQAWKENLILERYYAPFLDQINRDGNPFRFPDATRAAIDAARPRRDPYPYDSPVGRVPARMWLWPSKTLLWCATAAVALGSIAVSEAFGARRRGRSSTAAPAGSTSEGAPPTRSGGEA